MTLHDTLLFVHVLAAMLWLGGVTMLAALGTVAVRSGDAPVAARLLAALRRIGPLVLAPAPFAVVGMGVWLVLHDAAWTFAQTWIEVALGLVAAALAVGLGHQARTAFAVERAAAEGRDDDVLRHVGRWTIGMWLLLLVLAAATWDMVFKPGL